MLTQSQANEKKLYVLRNPAGKSVPIQLSSFLQSLPYVPHGPDGITRRTIADRVQSFLPDQEEKIVSAYL